MAAQKVNGLRKSHIELVLNTLEMLEDESSTLSKSNVANMTIDLTPVVTASFHNLAEGWTVAFTEQYNSTDWRDR